MKIIDTLVEVVALVHRFAGQVARHDPDLVGQMKRSSSSTALNASEGVRAKAGKRRSRLEDAMNSARETLMAAEGGGGLWLSGARRGGRGYRGAREHHSGVVGVGVSALRDGLTIWP